MTHHRRDDARAGRDAARLDIIRRKWRSAHPGAVRAVHDGVCWRLDADVFWSRPTVEAFRDAPGDVAWLLDALARHVDPRDDDPAD